MPNPFERVLLTGATGFVGRNLFPGLARAGYEVVCASRSPAAARRRWPDRAWRALDVDRPATLPAALQGCDAAYYLLHGMTGGGADYEVAEAEAARHFAGAAGEAGLRRIVYLGGIEPAGVPSRHLRSRLAVGRILREGPVPTVELRAAMIIGAGSESWRITRDLAARLPAMILPRWLESRSQPVGIQDVVAALLYALEVPEAQVGVYDVPGPEVLTARDILLRIARLMGMSPIMVGVPLLTPRLSSYWIQLVTRADSHLARELVEGLRTDILARDEGLWRLLPRYRRMGFDEAARRALEAEAEELPVGARAVEALIRAVALKPRRPPRPPESRA